MVVRLHQVPLLLNSWMIHAVDVNIFEATTTTKRETVQSNCAVSNKKKTKQQTYHAESVKQTYRTQRKEAGSGDNSAAGVTRIILFAYDTITRPFFPSLNVTFRCNINIPFVSTTVFLESIAFKQIQVQNPSIQPAHLTLYRWKCTFL